jgi:hypothetical protein
LHKDTGIDTQPVAGRDDNFDVNGVNSVAVNLKAGLSMSDS